MSKQKLSDLAKKRGIYAVLLVGVFVVVSVVMVILTNRAGDPVEEDQIDLNDTPPISAQQNPNNNSTYAEDDMQDPLATKNPGDKNVLVDNSPVTVTETPEVTPVAEVTPEPTKKADEVATTKDTQTAKDDKKDTQPVMQNTAKNLSFKKEDGLTWPIKGNVIKDYSVDRTTYHETLKQYMTNPGILIACEVGTDVKASTKGVITSITEEARTGNTVVMDIGNDYRLVYGQLEDIKFKVGDTVKASEVIGKVAKATKFYIIEGPHLYFQVLEGDQTIDPMSLLKSE